MACCIHNPFGVSSISDNVLLLCAVLCCVSSCSLLVWLMLLT